jgi:hypothetical protein
VDEYGLALEQALRYLLPTWEPAPRRLQAKLGFDVDEIGIPFSVRSVLGHTLRRGSPMATLRDLAAPVTGIDTSYQLALREIVGLARDRSLDTAVYWKASAPGPHDTGYDPGDRKIRSLIECFRNLGVEMGIHPGYGTFGSLNLLRREVSALRNLLGSRPMGGRQDFLRWNPQTWVHWESLDLAYDASIGFADHIGFRAGTCLPYTPWLLSERREAKLVEIPLLAMDATLQSYMRLDCQQALVAVRDCIARCRAVGGTFSLLWHNTKVNDGGYRRTFLGILDELEGSDHCRWEPGTYRAC